MVCDVVVIDELIMPFSGPYRVFTNGLDLELIVLPARKRSPSRLNLRKKNTHRLAFKIFGMDHRVIQSLRLGHIEHSARGSAREHRRRGLTENSFIVGLPNRNDISTAKYFRAKKIGQGVWPGAKTSLFTKRGMGSSNQRARKIV